MKKILISIIIGTLALTAPARALTPADYGLQGIDFYSSKACSATGSAGGGVPNVSSSESEDKNAEQIFKFLISTKFSGLGGKPFNAIQAAGALGNFFQESRFDPGAIEGNGEGHGLAQWSFDRKTALFALAKSEGKQWNDMGLQFLMIQREIDASYGKSLLNENFGSVSSPKEASYIFQAVYESARVPAQATRDGAAQKYYDKFKDMAPDSGAIAGASGVTGCGTGSSSQFSADGFIVYNQCDTRWANVPYGDSNACVSGCGPSAMAAAITALTKQEVTPKDTVPYASSRGLLVGGGSSWNLPQVLGDHWGLKSKQIPATVGDINKVLQAGGLVIMAGKGAAPFTSGGHYILIRGVTTEGKWKISDSNGEIGQTNSKKDWDAQPVLDKSIANGIGSIYSLTN
ncbi:MAG TPA: phage tail tip lysozyme [Candidatus Saccharimonadales bacterium]|nr:phage tail tip lysozyme [Candidatus Saccharimonadales bacterium]